MNNLMPLIPKTQMPKSIVGPAAWYGHDLQKDSSWTVQWTQAEIDELVEAGNYFLSLNKPLEEVSPNDFPLPSLFKKIKSFSNELLFGRGFLLIRGLPVGRPFISNPDLVEKLRTGMKLTDPDMTTFYTPGEKGYTDY
jgi:hypothetical protein